MTSDNTKKNIDLVKVNESWCKGCGICAEFCPKNVFEMRKGKSVPARPEDCILCGLCQLRCPDFAIELEENNHE